jgi:hypothetical protein
MQALQLQLWRLPLWAALLLSSIAGTAWPHWIVGTGFGTLWYKKLWLQLAGKGTVPKP